MRTLVMADLAVEGPHSLEPVEPAYRYHREELEDPVPPLHYLERDVADHLLPTTVPEPIRLRGIGGTTMLATVSSLARGLFG